MSFWMCLKKHRPAVKLFSLGLFALFIAANANAKPYKGAEVITHEEFKYGAFEARIKAAEGPGYIFAYFLWKNDSELPETEWQEQDFEIFGKNGRYQTQIMTPGNPRTSHEISHSLPTAAYDRYYTYRMEWTPDYLAFYVDGELVRMETDRVEFAKHLDPARAEASQIRLSLWAGDSGWSGQLSPEYTPAAGFVDYFHVYDYDQDSKTFVSRWRDDFEILDFSRWWLADWTFSFAVNDYSPNNARAIDGKLVIAFTTEENEGVFPTEIPEDEVETPIEEEEVDVEVTLIPARIEATYFANAFDTTLANLGDSTCNTGSVDAELTRDTSGYCNIGWTVTGEWLEYKIDVPVTGAYDLTLRLASHRVNNTVNVEVIGQNPTASIESPSDGWETFSDIVVPLWLTQGEQTVRINFETGDVNINYLSFDYADSEPVEPTPTDPEPVEPTPTDPEPVEPTPTDPEPVEPTPTDPEPVEPTPTDPEPVEPTPTDPEPVEPTPTDPEPVEPQICTGITNVEWNERTEINLAEANCISFPEDLSDARLQAWDSDENTSCNFRGVIESSSDSSISETITANYNIFSTLSGTTFKLTPSNSCQYIKVRAY